MTTIPLDLIRDNHLDDSQWIEATGRLRVVDKSIHVVLSNDFIDFYKWLIDRRIGAYTNSPMHGAHITLWNQRHHQPLDSTKKRLLYSTYGKNPISFMYHPNIIIGGYTKGFYNFFMCVRSRQIDNLCEIIHQSQPQNLHVTVCNTKGGTRPYIQYKVQ